MAALDTRVCDRARLARDARFDGQFFIAVLSTGIYCRPSCPARTARRENVRYFRSVEEAVAAGFRACLRCRPETAPGAPACAGRRDVEDRGRIMRSCEVSSPVGRLRIAGDEKGLRSISFEGRFDPAEVSESRMSAKGHFREVIAQLEAYFAGELRRFDLPLAPEGTAFQREVWSALTAIPYGETVSYSGLARRLGRPAASRAVGAANGRNPIPIVIPCHRVVGADGSLTGFGGGLAIKRRLLELEAGAPGPSLFSLT